MSQTKPAAKDLERFDETLGFLEAYLSQSTYSALDHLTIADIAISVTLLTAKVAVGHDLSKFPKVSKYLGKCQAEIVDFKEIIEVGVLAFKTWVEGFIKPDN